MNGDAANQGRRYVFEWLLQVIDAKAVPKFYQEWPRGLTAERVRRGAQTWREGCCCIGEQSGRAGCSIMRPFVSFEIGRASCRERGETAARSVATTWEYEDGSDSRGR